MRRSLLAQAPLLAAAEANSTVVLQLDQGDTLDVLDASRGWAWGYAGTDRLVGYVTAASVGL